MSKETAAITATLTNDDKTVNDKTTAKQNKAFTSLLPIFAFIKPYKLMLALALIALLLTAAVNLSLGQGVGMTPHVKLNHKNLCFFSSHNSFISNKMS